MANVYPPPDLPRRIPFRNAATAKDRLERFFRPYGLRAVLYDYVVTPDEFDRDDNEGPGHYVGIATTHEAADRWDLGIREAKRRGLTDEAAVSLRQHVMAGGDPETWVLPPEVAEAQRRREEAERRAREEAERARQEAEAQIRGVLAGLECTSYGPRVYATTDLGSPVLENPHQVRLPNGLGWTALYRHPEGVGYVSVYRGVHGDAFSVLHWVPPDVARAYRLRSARELGVTPERARESVGSPCIDEDQRAMYQAVLEEWTKGG